MKYYNSKSQNNDTFYLFNDQLDYTPAHNFANSQTTKCNIDRFLSNSLMTLLIEKLSYQNTSK